MRVSTNEDEQLQSFKSQKKYYQDKISANKNWLLVGIYADEGITGTKINKRDEFLRMIFDLYVQGYGAYTIAKEHTRMGKVNKKGYVK